MTFRVTVAPPGKRPIVREFRDLGEAKTYRRLMAEWDPDAEIERVGADGKAAVEPGNGPLSAEQGLVRVSGRSEGGNGALRGAESEGEA